MLTQVLNSVLVEFVELLISKIIESPIEIANLVWYFQHFANVNK